MRDQSDRGMKRHSEPPPTKKFTPEWEDEEEV
jgi:hypothetical protein